jgi:hypothetical protein
MRFPYGTFVPSIWGVLSTAFTALVALILLAVIAALIFLLVRFLLVGTRAAELYIARNSDTGPIAIVPESAPVAPEPVTPEPVAPEPVTPEPVTPEPTVIPPTKPLPRTRTPKAPPKV